MNSTQRVQPSPGVKSGGFLSPPPIGAGTGRSGGVIVGYTPLDKPIVFYRHQIGPGYFETLGVPIVLGRGIEERDGLNAKTVVVVNEKMAATYFRGDDPVGHTVRFGSPEKPIDFEIVGVVKDLKYSQIRA